MPDAPLDTTRPFTTRMALAAGITAGQLRGPGYRRLAKGVHVAATTTVTPLVLVEAALASHPPEAFASHGSAAVVYGMPVPAHSHRHVSVPTAAQRRRRPDVVCHLAASEARVLTVRGIRVSPPAQTFVELASELGLVDLVVVGDFIVRKQWCSAEQLVAFCRSSPDPHAARALAAARFVRPGVDSPTETRLRLLLVLAGFPEPQVNYTIRDENGDVLVRFDLSYPSVQVAVEYDGRQHADSAKQYARDISRRETLDSWQWRIVVITSPGIFVEPERTLARVADVLRERGLPGVPKHLDERWRLHFPGRPGSSAGAR